MDKIELRFLKTEYQDILSAKSVNHDAVGRGKGAARCVNLRGQVCVSVYVCVCVCVCVWACHVVMMSVLLPLACL